MILLPVSPTWVYYPVFLKICQDFTVKKGFYQQCFGRLPDTTAVTSIRMSGRC